MAPVSFRSGCTFQSQSRNGKKTAGAAETDFPCSQHTMRERSGEISSPDPSCRLQAPQMMRHINGRCNYGAARETVSQLESGCARCCHVSCAGCHNLCIDGSESARSTAGVNVEVKPGSRVFMEQPVRLNIPGNCRFCLPHFSSRPLQQPKVYGKRPLASKNHTLTMYCARRTHSVAVHIDTQTGKKLINEYEIIGELGRGEHGKVKLGVHLNTGRRVAIKVVQRHTKRKRLGKVEQPEDKVKREVAILKKARHPNVVSLLEVIDDPNQQKVYIVLEYVENGEIIWRRRGIREIVLVDKKRLRRERQGLPDHPSFRVDNKEAIEWPRHERVCPDDLQDRACGAKAFDIHGWSLEHGGDVDEVCSHNGAGQLPFVMCSPGKQAVSHIDKLGSAYTLNASSRGHSASGYFDLPDDGDDFSYVPCLTIGQVRSAFRDTVLGLEYLHYHGIIHRDIKPANLLVSKSKRIKISDFGVSYLGRPMSDDSNCDATDRIKSGDFDDARELSKTVGTPAFYAPELCYAGPGFESDAGVYHKVSAAIDIWALGVTLYAMIYGRLPFTYDHHSLFYNITHTPVFIPSKRLKPVEAKPRANRPSFAQSLAPELRLDDELAYEDVDDNLRDLIGKLLIKTPERRITLNEIKRHAWVLRGMDCSGMWLASTDPSLQSLGKRIEVSNEEIKMAVTRVPFMQRVRCGVERLGNTIFGRTRGKGGHCDKNEPRRKAASQCPPQRPTSSVEDEKAPLSDLDKENAAPFGYPEAEAGRSLASETPGVILCNASTCDEATQVHFCLPHGLARSSSAPSLQSRRPHSSSRNYSQGGQGGYIEGSDDYGNVIAHKDSVDASGRGLPAKPALNFFSLDESNGFSQRNAMNGRFVQSYVASSESDVDMHNKRGSVMGRSRRDYRCDATGCARRKNCRCRQCNERFFFRRGRHTSSLSLSRNVSPIINPTQESNTLRSHVGIAKNVYLPDSDFSSKLQISCPCEPYSRFCVAHKSVTDLKPWSTRSATASIPAFFDVRSTGLFRSRENCLTTSQSLLSPPNNSAQYAQIHIPVPDREEGDLHGNVDSSGVSAVHSRSSIAGDAVFEDSSTDDESEDGDGLLYLGKVPRPVKVQMSK